MIYFRNRRGQVAILMLFVVAIVLVIATLFVFFKSDSASPPSSGFFEMIGDGLGNLDSVRDMAGLIAEESIVSHSSFFDVANVKYNALSTVQIASYGNFFKKIQENDFIFAEIKEVDTISKQEINLYKFKVNGLFVQGNSGNNYEKKDFDLCMLFDESGDYLKELANEEFYVKYCNK